MRLLLQTHTHTHLEAQALKHLFACGVGEGKTHEYFQLFHYVVIAFNYRCFFLVNVVGEAVEVVGMGVMYLAPFTILLPCQVFKFT